MEIQARSSRGEPRAEASAEALPAVAAGSGEPERPRLVAALSAAMAPGTAAGRRGIPGLRKELFPAASWRDVLATIEEGEQDRRARLVRKEAARMDLSLAKLRSEDILRRARAQARRLVRTAAAVARARRDQAERASAELLAEAEQVAAATVAAAQEEAQRLAETSGHGAAHLHERLVKLQAALRDAEVRLEAFSASTRSALGSRGDVIDLDAEAEAEDDAFTATVESGREDDAVAYLTAPEVTAAPYEGDEPHVAVPRVRPKSRFVVPGLTPDRIEALRDELTP